MPLLFLQVLPAVCSCEESQERRLFVTVSCLMSWPEMDKIDHLTLTFLF